MHVYVCEITSSLIFFFFKLNIILVYSHSVYGVVTGLCCDLLRAFPE